MKEWPDVSDDDLVKSGNASIVGTGQAIEMQRRLKEAVKASERTTVRLSTRIEYLTWALIVFTIIIAILTGALVYKEFWAA